jgi:hypothetical protein
VLLGLLEVAWTPVVSPGYVSVGVIEDELDASVRMLYVYAMLCSMPFLSSFILFRHLLYVSIVVDFLPRRQPQPLTKSK